MLDALINLGGPIKSVDAKLYEQKPPPDPRDLLAALVQFSSGATGMLATVRAAPNIWRVHVFGTKGMAEARDENTLTVSLIGGTPQTHTYEQVELAESSRRILRRRRRRPRAVSRLHQSDARPHRRLRSHPRFA